MKVRRVAPKRMKKMLKVMAEFYLPATLRKVGQKDGTGRLPRPPMRTMVSSNSEKRFLYWANAEMV